MAVSEGSGFSRFSRLSRLSRLSSISSLSRFHEKSGISWYILPPVPQKAGFHFALLSPCTSLEKIGCGSEEAKTKNVVFHFALLSPCTIFALTFHTYIYIYLRLW